MSVACKLGVLAVANSLLFCVAGWAQTPSNVSTCSSALAQQSKLTANDKGPTQGSSPTKSTHRRVILERIEFDQPVQLSNPDVDAIVKKANDSDYDASSSAWVDRVAETGLRQAWQDHGYFEVAVDPTAQSLGGNANEERFVLKVHVLEEGPQFHLGTLQFTGGTVFSDGELRQAIPMREGEIFNVAHVRASIESLVKLYGAHGYIDFTITPSTDVDTNLQRIDLTWHLDEGNQFRVRNVEIRGIDPTLEGRLRAVVVPGQPIDPEAIRSFLKDNRSVLPRGIDNFEMDRDVKDGLVDFTFAPRNCSDSD